jgi:hypothetical protein
MHKGFILCGNVCPWSSGGQFSGIGTTFPEMKAFSARSRIL